MSRDIDDKPVQLLWTGGWDSTFRLLQLLLVEQRPVQPMYVIDTGRASTVRELETMQLMRAELARRMPDPSLCAPTKVFVATDYPPSRELERLYGQIASKADIGSQYLWLAGVAETLGWEGVELSVEGLQAWGRLVFIDQGVVNDSPEAQLFHFWSFPVLHTSKLQMREIAREHGFLDLLLQRWFCFSPIGRKPCGRCNPCLLANRDGVEFAHPALGVARAFWRRASSLGAAPTAGLPTPAAPHAPGALNR